MDRGKGGGDGRPNNLGELEVPADGVAAVPVDKLPHTCSRSVGQHGHSDKQRQRQTQLVGNMDRGHESSVLCVKL